MPFWRRREETLNERLLREAGLETPDDAGEPAGPAPDEPLRWEPQHVVGFPWHRPGSEPDLGAELVGVVDAAGVQGSRVQFVTLPDGSLVVEDERGDAELAPFADAVERTVPPPYRAVGRREDDGRWVVGATRIDVRELPGLPGDAISLASNGGERTLTVDDRPSSESAPGLEVLAGGRDAAISAERLDGDWWEVRVGLL